MSPRIGLIGPPGAGKSTVAAELGRLLDLPVRDTDTDVERAAGMPVAEIFVEHGENHFRELERQAVVTALAEHDGVLALGGGAVLDPRTEADLSGHPVVFLDVSVTHAARRIGLNRDRPLLIGNPRAQWLRLMEARRPVYERVSTIRVSTDDRSPAQIAEEVRSGLLGATP
jgi:shikimate kinase